MAKASITNQFDNGSTVTVAVESTNDYPDATADVILRVAELYRLVVPDEAE